MILKLTRGAVATKGLIAITTDQTQNKYFGLHKPNELQQLTLIEKDTTTDVTIVIGQQSYTVNSVNLFIEGVQQNNSTIEEISDLLSELFLDANTGGGGGGGGTPDDTTTPHLIYKGANGTFKNVDTYKFYPIAPVVEVNEIRPRLETDLIAQGGTLHSFEINSPVKFTQGFFLDPNDKRVLIDLHKVVDEIEGSYYWRVGKENYYIQISEVSNGNPNDLATISEIRINTGAQTINKVWTCIGADGQGEWLAAQSGGAFLPLAGGTLTGRLLMAMAATATPNIGTLSIGNGAFDGVSSGKFVGNANGTKLAINAASGYTGDLMNLQVGGNSRFKINKDGDLSTRNIFLNGDLSSVTPPFNTLIEASNTRIAVSMVSQWASYISLMHDGGSGDTGLGIFGLGTSGGYRGSIRMFTSSNSRTPVLAMFIDRNQSVGIGLTDATGLTVDASSKFQIISTTKGSMPFPKMTDAQRSAIASPAIGLHVYQTDSVEGVYVYKSGGWAFAY